MWSRNKEGYLCLSLDLDNVYSCSIGKKTRKCPKQTFSSHYVTGTYSALCDIPKDASIFCVGYSLGDMQVSVTGTCFVNESEYVTAFREIVEELGILFNYNYLRIHSHGQHYKRKRDTTTVFTLCADDCKPMPIPNRENIIVSTDRHDRSRKVSIIIYGSKEGVNRMMEMAYPLDKNERIIFYGSVPSPVTTEIARIMKHVSEHPNIRRVIQ